MRRSIILSLCAGALLVSCTQSGQPHYDSLQAKIDSLQRANWDQEHKLDEIDSYMRLVLESMDSIARQQGVLLFNDLEGRTPSKQQLKKRLQDFADLVDRQREQIIDLQDKLEESQDAGVIANLRKTINYLEAQLAEKDRVIASLRSELDKANANIREVTQKLKEMQEANQYLTSVVERQKEAIYTQGEIMNECYVKWGSRRDLQREGILLPTAGDELDVNNFKNASFQAVDIREFDEIELNTTRPKVLTQMPEESYELIREGRKTILHVTDPALFWSISNYLVILER